MFKEINKEKIKITRTASPKKEDAVLWRIPGTGEPGGLPSVGSHRVGHD